MNNLWSDYLKLSASSFFLLFLGSIWVSGNLLPDHLFITTLMAVSFYSFYKRDEFLAIGIKRKIAWVTTQFFLLLGQSTLDQNLAPIYLGILALAFGAFAIYFDELKNGNETFGPGHALAALSIGALIISYDLLRHTPQIIDWVYLVSFILWPVLWMREIADSMFSWRQEFGGEKLSVCDRIFYHDLINHTHGLLLFINNKKDKNEGITPIELNGFINELIVMQKMIKEYFGEGDKSGELKTFEAIRLGFENMLENYLPKNQINLSLKYEGDLRKDAPFELKTRAVVHYPTFLRIMHNIVKNIYEAESKEVEIILNYKHDGLHITTTNKILHLKDHYSELEHKLSEMIKHETFGKRKHDEGTIHGVGLESVLELSHAQKGEFSFAIEDDSWVNRVFLPRPIHAIHPSISTYKKSA